LSRLWKLVNQTNAYFHAQEPWKLSKSDPEKFKEVLSATCHSLRTIAVLLWPIMPQTMETLLGSIGIKFNITKEAWSGLDLLCWKYQFKLTKVPALFNKIEQVKEEQTKKVEQSSVMKDDGATITIDTVAQVELVVGTIENVDLVEKSDKLLKLHVDFGSKGKRTILAGIRKLYLPVDLIGKQAVFVYNLKPRSLMGYSSQGMLLVAEDANGGHFIAPEQPVMPGTRLK
jgi:methionyl-tRNA synthetase